MAFTQNTDNLNIIQALADLPNETDGLSSSQMKAKFDEAVNLLKTFLNSTLIAELEAQTASASLGAVVGGGASNIQNFINIVEAAGVGSLPPDNSLTTVKFNSSAFSTSSTLVENSDTVIASQKAIKTYADAIQTIITSHIANRELHPPAGCMFPYGANSAPSGYLECDGSAISRVTYSDLFSAIGTTFGVGDGATTFNIPDLRGYHVRGWDNGAGVDTARVFGSAQTDQNKAHTHTGTTDSGNASHIHDVHFNGNATINYYAGESGVGVTTYRFEPLNNTGPGEKIQSDTQNAAHTHAFTTGSNGGTEARVKNIALMYIIKY